MLIYNKKVCEINSCKMEEINNYQTFKYSLTFHGMAYYK